MRIEHVHVGDGAQAVIENVQPGSKVGANQAIIEPEDARPLKRSGSLARSQLRGEIRSYFWHVQKQQQKSSTISASLIPSSALPWSMEPRRLRIAVPCS